MKRVCLIALMGILAACPVAAADPVSAIPMTIDEAEEIGIQRSDPLASSILIERRKAAEMNLSRANRLPEITASVSSSYMTNPPEGITLQAGAFGSIDIPILPDPIPLPDSDVAVLEDTDPSYYQIRVSLTQPLYTWGKLNAAVDIAELDHRSATAETQSATQKALRGIRKAYYGAKASNESRKALSTMKELLSEILEDRERAYLEGSLTKEDVLKARKNLVGVTAQLMTAESAGMASSAALRFLLDTEAPISPYSSYPTELPELSLEELTQSALENSIDLNVLEIQRRQATIAERIAVSNRPFRPDIGLSIDLDVTGSRLPLLQTDWQDTWETNLIFTIGAEMTVFDSGKSKSSVLSTSINTEMAAQGIAGMRRGMEASVASALNSVNRAYWSIQEVEASISLSEEQMKNARVSYSNELITRETLLAAETALTAEGLRLINAKLDFTYSLIDLEFLTGALVFNLEQ